MKDRDPLNRPTTAELLFCVDCLVSLAVLLWLIENNDHEYSPLISSLTFIQIAGMYFLADGEAFGRKMKKQKRHYKLHPEQRPYHPKDTWPEDKTRQGKGD